MKSYPKREVRKKSFKSKYCDFIGTVVHNADKIPRYITCPVCKRRLEPDVSTCTGGREDFDWACCNTLSLKRHIRKK